MLFRNKISLAAVFCMAMTISGCAGGARSISEVNSKVDAARQETVKVQTAPHNIVIMLPLKGTLAATSQAIRDGFLASYDYVHSQQPDVSIKVIDTADGDVVTLYNQAVAAGADVVVGPLTKQEVEKVMNINPLPVPTIALNTLDDYSHNSVANLYQFGLLPRDEAIQAALRMTASGHKQAAIIAPDGAWGDKISTAFRSKYEESGGQVVANLNYHFGKEFALELCNFLATNPDELCAPKKHRNKNAEASDEPKRRQDIDTIFLVATAAQARQIVPLLKFYYAGDLPIYSISPIFSGNSRPSLDQDIDDVYFCDMPWVLKDASLLRPDLQAIKSKIISLGATSFANYSKFYALGVDAYNLAFGLNEILNAPQVGFDGASGMLYLDNQNHFYRELQWAQMKQGQINLLSDQVEIPVTD